MAEDAAALEAFITEQLAGLSLTVAPDDVELMARFVEEDLEREDKLEGVRGMLEGVVEGGELPANVDDTLDKIITKHDEMRAAAEARAAEEAAANASPEPEEIDHEAILASATEEELAAARKAALLRQYAYVEGGPADELEDRAGAPPRGVAAAEAEAKRKAEERKRLIMEAMRIDGMKKKNRKKHAQFDDPLMWENLNKEKVQVANALARDQAKAAAQEKRNRDRAALEKQRADAAKAKAEKQKKAQKQERRA